MNELNGIIKTKGNLKGTVNPNVKTKAAVSVGGTLISSNTSKRGIPGTDGFSPSATVTKEGGVATITITDKDGTTTAEIYDGSGSGLITDVLQNGTSVVDADGVAEVTVPTNVSDLTNDSGYISTETDPIFTASSAYGISSSDISNWNGKSDFSGDYDDLTNKPALFSGNYNDLTNKPTIPSKVSQLTNDSGFISSETDPVFTASAASGISSSDISAWNGKSTVSVSQKTASGTNIADITINGTTTQLYAPQGGGGTITDVTQNGTSVVSGGVAAVTVPTKVSDLNNDSGFITTETDPTVPSWAKQNTKPSYTFSEIGSKPTTISGYGITDAKISNGTITLGNNTITPLTSFTETDPTVPSWAKQSSKPSYTASEVGAVPTTRKVNGKALSADITLTATDVSALPASTAIPSKTSDLTNDSGFLTAETDPVFTASDAYGITASDISNWNGKDTVSVSRHTTSGTNIADITISGTTTKLYAPTSGGTTGTLVQLVRW